MNLKQLEKALREAREEGAHDEVLIMGMTEDCLIQSAKTVEHEPSTETIWIKMEEF